jgi:hypothetical protein
MATSGLSNLLGRRPSLLERLKPLDYPTAITTTTGRATLGRLHRFGSGKVNQPTEGLLGVLRRQDFYAIPRIPRG